VIALALFWAFRAANAQLRGTVHSTDGQALSGVAIELWTPLRKTAAAMTDGAGAFRFTDPERSAATAIIVRSIGYRPLREALTSSDTVLALVLQPVPISLDSIAVTAAPLACKSPEDPQARSLWNQVQQRYSHRYESVALGTLVRLVHRTVPAEQLGNVDTTGLAWGQRGAVGMVRADWRRWIADHGYAAPPGSLISDYGQGDWDYPPLESTLPQHFVDSLFGRLSKFTFQHRDSEGWVLAFCPKKDKNAFITGTLTIARDSTFVGATWTFHTHNPSERAGGQALFAPIVPYDSAAFLLPTFGLFWREGISPGEFKEVWQQFQGWVINWHDVLTVPDRPRAP
jgi:hypothetical protein